MTELARIIVPVSNLMCLIIIRKDDTSGEVFWLIPKVVRDHFLWTEEPPRVAGFGRLDTNEPTKKEDEGEGK